MHNLKARLAEACFFLFLSCFLFRAAPEAQAYSEEEANKMSEEMKQYGFTNVTTKEGLNFRIPPDLPIEKKNGVVAPVSFDEYLYVKFKKIDEKLTAVDKKVDALGEILKAIQKKLDTPKSVPSPADPS